ncbi:MAG TPA: fructosamine kinase family protein [Burkholderiales bacterium]|nr:fructosamine kinase family protein [Burkholderiales bacterium]
MSPWPDIERSIRAATGTPFTIESRAVIGGGCINECYVVRGTGRAYFVKLNAASRADMFAAEAEGLAEIARSNTVRVPQPVSHGADAKASWLVLEHLELRPGDARSMSRLGRNLARLHRVMGGRHGWHRHNTIGATPQVNTAAGDWVAFWRERRLGYQLKLAESRGHGGRLIATGERLLEVLPSFFRGYTPPPSLLHGDLWSGNAGQAAGGEPVIFDPAVYYGDREADLAMTELFGGFPQSFYEAYRAESPLDPGYTTRKHLYNLYHVLNHLNLFGGGYGAQAQRMIEQLLAAA